MRDPLAQANEALLDRKEDRVRGAAVLDRRGWATVPQRCLHPKGLPVSDPSGDDPVSDASNAREWLVSDGPEARCFGCGQRNEQGLRLRFQRTGPGAVEATYEAPEHFGGAPGVVHGGIQAALLDEALGFAAHAAPDGADVDIVTVEFSLRYRRPAPTGTPLRIRGRLLRSEGRDYWMAGEIVDASGGVLTEADARWRRIGKRTNPSASR